MLNIFRTKEPALVDRAALVDQAVAKMKADVPEATEGGEDEVRKKIEYWFAMFETLVGRTPQNYSELLKWFTKELAAADAKNAKIRDRIAAAIRPLADDRIVVPLPLPEARERWSETSLLFKNGGLYYAVLIRRIGPVAPSDFSDWAAKGIAAGEGPFGKVRGQIALAIKRVADHGLVVVGPSPGEGVPGALCFKNDDRYYAINIDGKPATLYDGSDASASEKRYNDAFQALDNHVRSFAGFEEQTFWSLMRNILSISKERGVGDEAVREIEKRGGAAIYELKCYVYPLDGKWRCDPDFWPLVDEFLFAWEQHEKRRFFYDLR